MNGSVCFIEGVELLFLGIGSYFDLKNQKIPIWFLMVAGVLAVFVNILFDYQDLFMILCGICVGGLLLIAGWISKEEIGYGDGIGVLVLGIFEGGLELLSILLIAFLLSSIWGVLKVIVFRKSRKEMMPFFPFLLISFLGGMMR